MVTKTQLKQILQLKQKKYRLLKGLFVAEGEKTVREFLDASWFCKNLFSVNDNFHPKAKKIDFTDMSRITHFKNPSPVLGVFEIPKSFSNKVSQITIAVDGIKDPGNLGTIIRTADWFGVKQIFLSQDCVDVFNPKVVQATMGSLSRVHICKLFLKDFLLNLKELKYISYGACLSGTSIYSVKTETKSVFVFGSESHGISSEVSQILDHKILIPGKNQDVDSLNVSVAFGIILSEFR